MKVRGLLVVAGCLVSCAPPPQIACGAGTHLESDICVPDGRDAGAPPSDAGPGDAGMPQELPVAAVIAGAPVRIMDGFAACPEVTVAWADGRSARLILDPEYRLRVPGAVQLAATGLTLKWSNSEGHVRSGRLPHCAAALVGIAPGVSTADLEVSNAAGDTRTIGRAHVEVLSLPSSGILFDRLFLNSPGPLLRPYHAPAATFSGKALLALPVGETREVVLGGNIDVPDVDGVAFQIVPENLELSSDNPLALQTEAMRVRGVAPGIARLVARYVVNGRTLGTAQADAWASDSKQTVELGLSYPFDDDGFVLPEAQRLANQVEVGQCFSFDAWATVAAIAPGETAPTPFYARASDAVWASLGTGLRRDTAQPNRFCAVEEGDAAVQACRSGICSVLGVVVASKGAAALTLAGSLPPEVIVPRLTNEFQKVCVPLQLTAQRGNAEPRDVSHSVALRFANPFLVMGSPLYPHFEAATGLPAHEPGKLCLDVRLEFPPRKAVIRFFLGNAQVELATTPRFQ